MGKTGLFLIFGYGAWRIHYNARDVSSDGDAEENADHPNHMVKHQSTHDPQGSSNDDSCSNF